jgi:hypothetical protein
VCIYVPVRDPRASGPIEWGSLTAGAARRKQWGEDGTKGGRKVQAGGFQSGALDHDHRRAIY